jgi:hypothetical protein
MTSSSLTKTNNPLRLVAYAAAIKMSLDLVYLAFFPRLDLALLIRVLANSVLLIAYSRRSAAAWHIMFVVIILIVPVNLICDRFGPVRRELSTSSLVIWLLVISGILFYLWRIRDSYFRYLAVPQTGLDPH